MAKKAIYYEEAKRLYVQNGIALNTIVDMLGSNVTRRTLFNWKEEGRWPEKRKRYLAEQEDLGDMVMDIALTAARNARANPTPKNLLALTRAIAALKEKDALTLLASSEGAADQKEEEEQDTKKAIRQAMQEIMGV